jgi:hypothetical protein
MLSDGMLRVQQVKNGAKISEMLKWTSMMIALVGPGH